MKGEKGTCATDKSNASIYRTKFDTEKHACDALEMHVNLGTTKPDNVI